MMLKLIKYFSIIFLSTQQFWGDLGSRYLDSRSPVTPRYASPTLNPKPTLKSIEYKPDEAKESQLGPATIIAENAVTNNCRNYFL